MDKERIRMLVNFDEEDTSTGYVGVTSSQPIRDYVEEIRCMCCKYGRYTDGKTREDEIWYIPLKDSLKPFKEPLMISKNIEIDGRIEYHWPTCILYVQTFNTTTYKERRVRVDKLDIETQEKLAEWAQAYCDNDYL